jgi:hypothetical protein
MYILHNQTKYYYSVLSLYTVANLRILLWVTFSIRCSNITKSNVSYISHYYNSYGFFLSKIQTQDNFTLYILAPYLISRHSKCKECKNPRETKEKLFSPNVLSLLDLKPWPFAFSGLGHNSQIIKGTEESTNHRAVSMRGSLSSTVLIRVHSHFEIL